MLSCRTDIYISCVSNTNMVAPKGWYIAMVSTTVETTNPEAEILPGLQLLGSITEKLDSEFDDHLKFFGRRVRGQLSLRVE